MSSQAIKISPKFKPLWTSDTRYFVLTGGRGSAKSFSTNLFTTQLTFQEKQRVLFTRYTMTSARISIVPEFVEKIEILNAADYFEVKQSEIINSGNGSTVLFRGIKTSSGEQTANLKSLQGVTTWVLDEAEELHDETLFDKIDLSIRTKGVQNRVIIILNPATKEHWIYKRFFELAGVEPGFNGVKGDTTYIHTTYKDNESNLDESFLKRVEQMRIQTPNKYKHQILGGWLEKSEGVVFNNWRLGEFIDTGQTIFGQDYGFYPDPTTLVQVSADRKNKRLYIKQCFVENNLSTQQIIDLNKRYCGRSLIIGDSAEPRLIEDIRKSGVNILKAEKGAGSIIAGINLLLEYELIIDPDSTEIVRELNNYAYSDKKTKLVIDDWNHCFIGETLISTENGSVPIKEIEPGTLVHTSEGLKPVLFKFNNGVKKVFKYSMQFDTFCLYLTCTPNHKIKTNEGWIEIQNLKPNQIICLNNILTEKHIICTKAKGTSVKAVKDCTGLFGNFIMNQLKKVITYITKTETRKTTILKIYQSLANLFTLDLRVKKGLTKIKNGSKVFTKKELKPQKNGIKATKEGNGIQSTQKNLIQNGSLLKNNVSNAATNTKPNTPEFLNTAIKTAKLKHLGREEKPNEIVYDLMVDECHEYFANGVLVHNCIDALRYAVEKLLKKTGNRVSSF